MLRTDHSILHPPPERSPDESILQKFKSVSRGVVWQRGPAPEDQQHYLNLLQTKYRDFMRGLDDLNLLLDVEEDRIWVTQGCDRNPEIAKLWGPYGMELTFGQIFPGSEEEKRPFIRETERLARVAADVLGEHKAYEGQSLRLHMWATTGYQPTHRHLRPVMTVNHIAPCTVDEKGEPLLQINDVGIIETGRLHASPPLLKGQVRLVQNFYFGSAST